MIQVEYYRGYNRIRVSGHADSGVYGHDLVCAAASTLVLTLMENVKRWEEDGKTRGTLMTVDSGEAEICAEVKAFFRLDAMRIFDAIEAGFEVLAREYPDYIRIVKKEPAPV